MRRRFGKIISQLAEKDEKIYVIVGDIGYRVFDEFRDKFPNRFINMGICEQSIISVASGMALEGIKPWIYTITPFLIERPFEQIKLDIDQQNVNVNLVGFADYPTLGPTHTEINAKKMMELFNNIESFFWHLFQCELGQALDSQQSQQDLHLHFAGLCQALFVRKDVQ
jgi:transketolase